VHIGFWWGNLSEGDQLEDIGLDLWIILKMDLREVGWDCIDWIDVAQDRDIWWADVNAVMKLGVL
jgi:hypothetical protein